MELTTLETKSLHINSLNLITKSLESASTVSFIADTKSCTSCCLSSVLSFFSKSQSISFFHFLWQNFVLHPFCRHQILHFVMFSVCSFAIQFLCVSFLLQIFVLNPYCGYRILYFVLFFLQFCHFSKNIQFLCIFAFFSNCFVEPSFSSSSRFFLIFLEII